jgi:hypothetical protein
MVFFSGMVALLLRESSLVWQWHGSNGRADASGTRDCADPSRIGM